MDYETEKITRIWLKNTKGDFKIEDNNYDDFFKKFIKIDFSKYSYFECFVKTEEFSTRFTINFGDSSPEYKKSALQSTILDLVKSDD